MTSAVASAKRSPSAADPERTWRVDSRLKAHLTEGTLPRDLLICGPAGTGKTWGILRVLHSLARDYRLRILFCRQTRASLSESVLITFEEEILPLDGHESLAEGPRRENRRRYVYPSGSNIVLGGLDRATKILSTAWDIVFVNESVEVQQEHWESLKSRLNRPGRDPRFGFLIGDTNPGPPDHWLKRRADEGRTTLWDTTHAANPALFDADARRWTPSGVAYREQLDTLTGTRRARLRDGLWAVGDGVWFSGFDHDRHVHRFADYNPKLPAYLAVDPGVHTGAVLFQVRRVEEPRADGKVEFPHYVNVFADYSSEGLRADENAAALSALAARFVGASADGRPKLAGRYCDPASEQRNAIGETVEEVFARARLPLEPWDTHNPKVVDSLAMVETLLNPIGRHPRLLIHPRCVSLVNAFRGYARAKRQDQWTDKPADPQHPYEDLIDALRGGLHARVRRAIDRLFL